MSSTQLYQGRFLELREDNGWEYCSRATGRCVVTLVAVTAAGELLLTEQHRTPVGVPVIELPAGLVGDDPGSESEQVQVAGNRELEEETGYRAARLEPLTEGPSSAGLSDEMLHFLRAHDLTRVGDGGGTDGEDIQVHKILLKQVPEFLIQCQNQGKRVDPKIYAGLWFLGQENG